MATYLNLAAVAAAVPVRGWQRAVQLPLGDFVAFLPERFAPGAYLRQLVATGTCPEIQGLLEQPLLAQQIRMKHGVSGEQQVATLLSMWLDRKAYSPETQAGSATFPAKSATGKAKAERPASPVRANGLRLGMSRQDLGKWVGQDPLRNAACALTVANLNLPAGTPLTSKGYMDFDTRLGDVLVEFAGRTYYGVATPAVVEAALRVLGEAERGDALVQEADQEIAALPVPAEAELAALHTGLLARRTQLRANHLPRPRLFSRQHLDSVRLDELVLSISDPDYARFCRKHGYQLSILAWKASLGQWRLDAPGGDCQGDCAVGLAAIDTVLRALQNPTPTLRKLAHALVTPPWALALEQVDEVLQAHDKQAGQAEREDLGWRVHLSDFQVTCEPVWVGVDRKGARRLKKATLSRLREDPLQCPSQADRDLLELPIAARDQQHLSEAAGLKAMSSVLRALAGHPRLFWPDDRPMQVQLATLQLALRPAQAGVRWLVRVGDREVELEQGLNVLRLGLDDLVVRGDTAVQVAAVSGALRKVLTALGKQPALPPEALPAVLQRLPQLTRLVPVEVPDGLRGQREAASTRPVLRLDVLPDGTLQIESRVRPLLEGPLLVPGQGGVQVHGQLAGTSTWTERDLAAELQARANLWTQLELPACEPADPAFLPLELGLDVTTRLQALDSEQVLVLWAKERRQTRLADTQHLRVELRDRIDWFGVGGTVQVGDAQVDLAEVLQAVRDRRQYVQVGGQLWLQLSEELRKKLERAADAVASDRSGLVLSPLQADALDGLVDLRGAPQRWQQALQNMRTAGQLPVSVPAGLQATLRHYQQEGVHWLLRLAAWAPGAVLADDMGLGKTLQALALLLDRRDRGPALVVAPTSVEANWLREAATFAPGLKCTSLRQSARKQGVAVQAGEVLVVSYDLLVRNAEALSAIAWATLVCDEAQAIKNSTTQRFKAVMGLEAEFRLGLTGTPVENHTGELWAIFTAVVPGLLGPWAVFQQRFAAPIERDGDAQARAALARVLRPFLLRRLKAQVAQDLPPRTEVRVDVEPSPAERALYQQVRTDALLELEALKQIEPQNKRFQVLAAITRLRQVACHPRLLDDASAVPSAKLAHVLDLLSELREEGHRALVFSQFVRHLALLREQLDKLGVPYRYLDGGTPEPQRRKEVAAFQKGEGDVFLISLKAGGTGLNLTGADYVLHLDPWWNPAVEDQATDRAHRIGQARPVTVYRLVASGTIEESILALHQRKRELVAGLLEGTGEASQLTTEQLVDLLRGA